MSSQGSSDAEITHSKVALGNPLSCPPKLVLVLQLLLEMLFSTLKAENHPMRLKEGMERKMAGSSSGNQTCLLSSHQHVFRGRQTCSSFQLLVLC